MNRMSRESLAGGRNLPAAESSLLRPQQSRRRGRSLDTVAGGVSVPEGGGDDGLDLFSKNFRSPSIAMADESDGQNVPPNLARVSLGLGKLSRSGMDDLLSSADMGKNDYDWLLTPPGSPLISSSDAGEPQLSSVVSRSNVPARSSSTTRTSRLSVSRTENINHSTKPARSSSAARPSVSATYSSSHFSTNSSRTSVLNTSSASVTSFRPSTPAKYSTTIATNMKSAPISRPVPTRSSTPAKTRPHSSSTIDKPRPANCSRPSTPTSRSQIPTNVNSSSNSVRSSRPSTPTQRAPTPSSSPLTTRSPSVGRAPATICRNTASASRPSSPGPRVRPPTPALVLPDFPLDVPPNLRTTLPDRPVSAGRTRPGAALTVRANTNSEVGPVTNLSRRQSSSPIVTRGRFPENTMKSLLHNSGHEARPPELHKPGVAVRKQTKPTASTTTATESTGFGRTISKKSLDMALRHMDIRQSMSSIRGTSIFPPSVRLTSTKGHPARMSDPVAPVVSNGFEAKDSCCNGPISNDSNSTISEDGHTIVQSPDKDCIMGRSSETTDIYGSSRYDAIMLKEDSKNMNWLHSVEDKSDQSPLFDHRFEPLLPEPFSLL